MSISLGGFIFITLVFVIYGGVMYLIGFAEGRDSAFEDMQKGRERGEEEYHG